MERHPTQGGTPLQFFSARPVAEGTFPPVRRGAQPLTPTTITKFFAVSIANTNMVVFDYKLGKCRLLTGEKFPVTLKWETLWTEGLSE